MYPEHWRYYQYWKRFIHLTYCLRNTVDDLDDLDDLAYLDHLASEDDIGNTCSEDITRNTYNKTFENMYSKNRTFSYVQYLERLSLRLLDGVDLRSSSDRGRLVLECAVETRYSALVEAALDGGVDVNGTDERGRTALHLATLVCGNYYHESCHSNIKYRGKSTVAKYELAAVDVAARANMKLSGNYWRTGVMALLLARGANVDAVDNYGWAAVHLAAAFCNWTAMGILLNNGADVSLKTFSNQTLLHCACILEKDEYGSHNYKFVDIWIKIYIAGAVKMDKDTAFNVSVPIDVNAQDYLGNTALHYFVSSPSIYRDNSLVEALIEYGSDVRLKNTIGDTALQMAVKAIGVKAKNGNENYWEKGDSLVYNIYLLVKEEIKHATDVSNGLFDSVISSSEPSIAENCDENNLLSFLQKHEFVEMANILVKYSEEFSVMDEFGNTLLHIATVEGDVNMVKLLLYGGLSLALRDLTSADDRMTEFCDFVNAKHPIGSAPISIAARFTEPFTKDCSSDNKTSATIKIDVDVLNELDESPLHKAVEYLHCDVVKLLLTHGSNTISQSNHAGYTALHLAFRPINEICNSTSAEDVYNTVELLLSYGAKVNLKTADNQNNLLKTSGYSALHLAVFNELGMEKNRHLLDIFCGNNDQDSFIKNVVELMLRYGADINIQSSNGETPLHSALNIPLPVNLESERTATIYKCSGLSDELISSSDKEKLLSILDNKNLCRAAEEIVRYNIVRALLVEGADLYNKKDENGLSVVETALAKGYLKIFQLLTRERVDINHFDDEGRTVLMLVVKYSYLDLVQDELDAGADVSKKDKNGFTALHHARSGRIVELLLSKGAETHEQSNDGSTALHCALRDAEKCDEECLDALIVSSSLEMKDVQGKTARDYCFELRDMSKIGNLLELYKSVGIMQHLNDTLPLKDYVRYEITEYYCEFQWLSTVRFCAVIFKYILNDLRFTKNSDLISFLESDEFDQRFEHIKNFVKRRFAQAKRMPELLDEVSELFLLSLFNNMDLNIPAEVCRIILERTTPPDIINLRYALQL